MSGDTIKFAEASQPVNLGGKGSSEDAPPAVPAENAEAEIVKLADIKLAEAKEAGKKLSAGEAIRLVLAERKDLADQYSKK
jgi:hypothetical protein